MVMILFFKKHTQKLAAAADWNAVQNQATLVPYNQHHLISEQNSSGTLFCGKVILKENLNWLLQKTETQYAQKQASTFTLVPDNR